MAWIPEDFNLEVKIGGSIAGVNMKDTKLISKRVSLETTGEVTGIETRRLRNDECKLRTETGDIKIGSYIETGELDLKTKDGSVLINKRLGIGKTGVIEGAKNFKVGSVFSMMANLPEDPNRSMTVNQLSASLLQHVLGAGLTNSPGLLLKDC
jgi:hypothetical protein